MSPDPVDGRAGSAATATPTAMRGAGSAVTLTVNGSPVELATEGRSMLLHALRNELGLFGVRTGCSIGECGACTVLVDGVATTACNTPLATVAGSAVTTPEGLGTPDAPHPIQQAFLDHQAAQCGYCVNGMIMRLAGFGQRDADIEEAEIRDALDQHLCRCGTHTRIVAAACTALGSGTGCAPAAAGGSSPGADPIPAPDAAADVALPPGIVAHPRVEQWIQLGTDGTFLVLAGKVEIGQGIRTAFCQIAAAQLGVPMERVRAAPLDTDHSPDQRFTSGSRSIEEGGTAIAHAARACRRLLLERASVTLDRDPEELTVTADGIVSTDGEDRLPFVALALSGTPSGVIQADDTPRWDLEPIGQPCPRVDLPAKLTGSAAYLHDLSLPGMVHARVVLPPTPDAPLEQARLDAVRDLPGVVEVVIDGRIVIVLAEQEDQVIRAAERLRQDLVWGSAPAETPLDLEAHLRSLPAEPFRVRDEPGIDAALAGERTLRATYTTPYQSHGSMAPSVGVARLEDGHLHVWMHAQGIFPLRSELAAVLGMDEDDVTVEHHDGPGCYGMNGGDDAAGFAALAARAVPGRPVRLLFTIQDEFGWEPYGPAMVVDLAASLDAAGRLRAWKHHGITDTHLVRPTGAGDRLALSWLREDRVPRAWPGPNEGGSRNGEPLYDVGLLDVVADHVDGPLRTASLRCLGAFPNLFAIESFMDELAELAGEDPVAFRLRHLDDARARAVLEVAAERAGWQPHIGPSGRGMGVAVARYKGDKTYVAQVAEVDVDPDAGEFAVRRLVVVADAGTVVNPDGLRNQLEGGTLQGLSRALYEQITPGRDGVRQRDWTTYDVLRFRQVPELELEVLDRRGLPPLGAGEAATPVVAPAVANAIDDAIGIRLRRLPLTPAQLRQRLLEMGTDESRRVLL